MELLCPAGSFNSLKAAVQNGASAVYLGMSGFNARRFAANIDDIGEAVSYSHLRGCKVYLTLNTLVTDRELPEWAAMAERAALAGVDAFIVQDIGGSAVLRRMFPDIPLHASTQMTAHNSQNMRTLEQLGFRRVVLARELTSAQVGAITAATKLETEVFVHGALCVCYSGQCLMSGMLGGRSANRGACAQPCRLIYSRQGKSGHFLSTKDLSLVDQLPLLAELGVKSIKIEGRMKSAEYVAAVTRVYRKALDGKPVTGQDRAMLALAFNRGGFTGGMFTSAKNRLYALRPDHIGLPAGQIESVDKGSITVKSGYALHAGDEVISGNAGGVILNVSVVGKGLLRLGIKGAEQFEKGASLRITNDAKLSASLRASIDQNQRQTPLYARITVHTGEQAVLEVWTKSGMRVQVEGILDAEPARTHALSASELEQQIRKTGNHPFYFKTIETDLTPDTALPLSEINALRRVALAEISEKITDTFRHRPAQPYAPITNKPHTLTIPLLAAQVRNKEQAFAALPYADLLYVPVDADFLDQLPAEKGIVGAYPQIACDAELAQLLPYAERFPTVMVSGLMETAQTKIGDFSLNVTNSESLAELSKLGFMRQTLSVELNTAQISNVVVPDAMQTELIVYGRHTLMVTEHCPIDCGQKDCRVKRGAQITDRKGISFPLAYTGKSCRVSILNSLPLYMADQLQSFSADVFRMVFTIETPEECAAIASHYRRALHGKPVENDIVKEYTRGHYRRGV